MGDTEGEMPVTMEEGSMVVYIDGACSYNGDKNAAAGYGIYWGDDHKKNMAAKLPRDPQHKPTNNRAELMAAIVAIEQAKEMGANKLLIHLDSNYLVKGITEWIDS